MFPNMETKKDEVIMNLLIKISKTNKINNNINSMVISDLFENGSLTLSNLKYFEEIAANSEFHYPELKDVCHVLLDVENISDVSVEEIKDEISEALGDFFDMQPMSADIDRQLLLDYLNDTLVLSQVRAIEGLSFEKYLAAIMRDGFYLPIPLETVTKLDNELEEMKAQQKQ